MRWVSYHSQVTGIASVGFIDGDVLRGAGRPLELLDLLRTPGALSALQEQVSADPMDIIPLQQASLRAPIAVPPAVRDFMAFEEHVVACTRKFGSTINEAWYDDPCFYFTNPAAIIGPADPVPISPGSTMFDFELEIAAVIGKRGRDLAPDEAEGHIAGYTILADWSARDLQRRESVHGLGPAKGKDGSTSLGPWLVTPDELAPFRSGKGYDLHMVARLNGEEVSRGNWASIYWSFGEMTAYASRGTEVREGDVIGSGTVGGGCLLEQERGWLRAGDVVELEVEQLGRIVSRIVEGRPLKPIRLSAG